MSTVSAKTVPFNRVQDDIITVEDKVDFQALTDWTKDWHPENSYSFKFDNYTDTSGSVLILPSGVVGSVQYPFRGIVNGINSGGGVLELTLDGPVVLSNTDLYREDRNLLWGFYLDRYDVTSNAVSIDNIQFYNIVLEDALLSIPSLTQNLNESTQTITIPETLGPTEWLKLRFNK